MSENESLRQRTRRIIDEAGLRDPRGVAERVLQETPDDELRSALAEALPRFVQQVLMEHRPAARDFGRIPPVPQPTPAPLSPVPAASAPAPAFQAPGQSALPAPIRRPAGATRTRGFHGGAKYREGWQRALDAFVKGVEGVDKKLRDCTPEDLDAIASRLDRQADAAAARARGYREIARVMREKGASVVDALPAEDKMNLLGRNAA